MFQKYLERYPYDVQYNDTLYEDCPLVFVKRDRLKRKLKEDEPSVVFASWERALKHKGWTVAQSTHGNQKTWKVWIAKRNLKRYKEELNPQGEILEGVNLQTYVDMIDVEQSEEALFISSCVQEH